VRFLWRLFLEHQIIVTAAVTGWLGRTWNNAISSMKAPTEKSSDSYIFWFTFLNKMIGNKARAEQTAVENSPNWIPAVTKHLNNYNSNSGQ
jgi:hypothetical protein